MDPPEFGTVSISIKPKNGSFVSDFNKNRILSQLKQYSISGITQKLTDLKILYIELDSAVYFDDTKVSTAESLKAKVINSTSNKIKILGSGDINVKINLNIDFISKSAKEKLEKAGGKISLKQKD